MSGRSAAYWLQKLAMVPTAVGGHVALSGASNETLLAASLPERFSGDRRGYSTNFFLLQQGEVLKLHALNQDEVWNFYAGSPVLIHVFAPDGAYATIVIGPNMDEGQALQAAAPHNHWCGAELVGTGYALVGCGLAPGYDPRDSSTPSAVQVSQLKAAFPAQADVIERLTRS